MGGGVAALLVSILAVSDSASAFQLTISNTVSGGFQGLPNPGQSFKNNPAGSGASIFLDDWTFAYNDLSNANADLSKTLSIYLGGGNGGTLLYNSTSTTLVTFAGFNSVKWTFSGASLTDNAIYTAVIQGSSAALRQDFSTNPYPDGNVFSDSTDLTTRDTVFQANFSSATPVPFEFEPTGGLLILGGGWLLRRHLKKKKSTKV
jgi:hypothetical protein